MAYGFNDDRSKVEVYPADEIDSMVSEEAATRSTADLELSNQIGNILDNQDLDPNKDLELVDIRTGYDGFVSQTAGDSVRGQADRFNNWCEELSGQEAVPVSYYHKWIRDYYEPGTIITNVDSPADDTIPVDLYVIDCSPGDIFTLNARGVNNACAWCFIDSDDAVISHSTYNGSYSDYKLTAPEDSAKLIVHDYDCKKAIYKNESARNLMLTSGSEIVENYLTEYEKDGSYAYLRVANDDVRQKLYIRGKFTSTLELDNQYLGTMPTTGKLCLKIPYGRNVFYNVRTRSVRVADSSNVSSNDELLLFRISSNGDLVEPGYMSNYFMENQVNTRFNQMENRLDNIEADVPSYFSSHISTAVSNIITNINAGKTSEDPYPDVESFVFITDVHWGHNAKNSPALIDEIVRKTPVDLIVCGGDILYGHQATKQGAIAEMTDFIKKMRNIGAEFHCAYGNHDDNSVSNSDIMTKLTKQEQFNTLYSFNAGRKNTVFCFEDSSLTWSSPIKVDYYFDRPMTKTRFLVIDWNNPISGSRATWLQNVLSKNDGYRVVVIYHGIYSNVVEGTPIAEHVQVMSILEPYKNKIVAMFCGHMHLDYVEQDYYGNGSFPVVFTSCDMLSTGMSAGTVTEQCFDVVTIDYKNNEINLERIGYGSSRTVSL